MIALYIIGVLSLYSCVMGQTQTNKRNDMVLGMVALILAEMWRYLWP